MAHVSANGLRFHYQWHGSTGPVVVLINGLLTDLSSWSRHLSAFTGWSRVLTYDCRGQGETDKPDEGPYGIRQHAEDLRGLLDALEVAEAALVGVSNGACIALQFAVHWPHRVTALVPANTYGRADTAFQAKIHSWQAAMTAGGGPLRFDVSTPWIWGATFLNQHYDQLQPFREKGSALPAHAVKNLIAGAMEFDVLDQLDSITCPTLLLAGDEDVLTPLSYTLELKRRIRDSRIQMFENAGHCMFLEQAHRFADGVAEFLRQAL